MAASRPSVGKATVAPGSHPAQAKDAQGASAGGSSMFCGFTTVSGRVRRSWLAALGVLAALVLAAVAPDAAQAQDIRWNATTSGALASSGTHFDEPRVLRNIFGSRRIVYAQIPVPAGQSVYAALVDFYMSGDSGKRFEVFLYDGPVAADVATYEAMLAAPAIYSGFSSTRSWSASLGAGGRDRINQLAEAGGGVLTVGFRSDDTGAFGFNLSGISVRGVLDVPPVVTGVSAPTPLPGRPAVITGTGFTSASTVWFGGAQATVNSASATALNVTIPSGSGAVDVMVRTVVGDSDTSGTADDFTYMSPPPTPVITAPADGATLATASPTITGTATPGAQVRLGVYRAPTYVTALDVTVTADPSGDWSYDVPGLANGDYLFQASRSNEAGTSVASRTFSIAVPPAVSSLAPASGPEAGGTVVVITGTGFTGATEVAFGATPAAAFTVDSDTQITATAPAGTGAVDVRVTTDGGSSDTSGAGDDFTYVAPLSIRIHDASGPEGALVWFLVELSAPAPEGGVSYTVSTQDGTAVGDEDFSASSQDYVIPEGQTGRLFGVWLRSDALAEGDETFFANLTNVTGAVIADAQATGTIFDVPAPELSLGDVSVTEGDSGLTDVAIPLTLSAPAPFEGVAVVFELVDQTASRAEGDYTLAVAPVVQIDEGETYGELIVQVRGDTRFEPDETFLVNAVTVHRATVAKGQAVVTILNDDPQPAPTVTGLSPASAHLFEGPTVTVTGTGFTGATAVRFGSALAADLAVIDDNTLTVTAPGHGGGPNGGVVDVTVTGPGGVSLDAGAADDFRFIGRPVVSAVSPAEGPTTGGQEITVTGENLGGVSTVWFVATSGVVSGDDLVIDSDTQLRVTAPNRAGHYPDGVTFDIVPQNPVGEAERQDGPADDYVMIAGPRVTAMDVSQGPTRGGTRVTLSGTHLAAVTGVSVGGVAATDLAVSETDVAFDAPAGAGAAQITLQWRFGVVDTGLQFQFIPDAPTITAAPPALTNARDATFTVTGDDLRFSLDGGPATDVTSQPVLFEGLGDGEHLVSFWSATGGILSSAVTHRWTVDATAPAAPTLGSPAPGAVRPESPSQLSGFAEAGSTVVVGLNGAHVGDATADGAGAWSLPLGDDLGHGEHSVVLTARDAAGNVSPEAGPFAFTVDLSVPAAPTIASPAEGAALSDARPTFEGEAQAGTTVTIVLDGAPAGDTVADGAGRWTFTPTADLAEGAHTVTATATDGFGRAGPPSGARTFSIDTVAPDVPVLNEPVAGSVISNRTPTLRGAAEAGARVTVHLDGTPVGTVEADGNGAWSLAVATPLADGPHTVRLEAADALMNRSGLSPEVTFMVDATAPAAPVIDSPVDGAVVRTATPTFAGSAEPEAVLLVSLSGGAAGEATADGAGAWSFTAPALTPGAHTFEVVARDAVGNLSSPTSMAFTYVELTLRGGSLPQGQVARAYAARLSADGGRAPYVYAVTGGALPAGLRLDAAGDLEGDPSESGDFGFTVTATDADGFTATGTYLLTITPPAEPDASDVTDVAVDLDGAEGGAIDLSGAVRNAAYLEIVTPPAHGVVTIDGFEITYVPTPGYFGPDSFTYRAVGFADAGTAPVSRTATVSLTIAAPSLALAGGPLPAAATGAAYERGFEAAGGTAPYAYAVTAGALPTGLSLSSAGRLTGAPTEGGVFAFTVTASDSSTGVGPFSVSADYSLAVGAPVVTVTPASLPEAAAGQAYEQALSATGGVAPYAYAVTGGTLPAGLSLSADGVLSGVPTAGGAFEVTVTVTDSSTGAGPYASEHVLGLTVAAAAVTVTPGELPAATRGVAYAASLAAAGGVAPYAFSLDEGALPAGVSLSADGVLTGTPSQIGTFEFTVRATDSATGEGPYSGVRTLMLEVDAAAISVTPTELPGVLAGVPYSQQLSAAGGTGDYTFAVSGGALPDGLSLSPAGLISGRATTGGDHAFTVTAADAFGNTGSASLVIEVTGRPDPSADPDVRGLNLAQAEAVRRMARTQLDNFNRRLERLRSGQAGSDMGLTLNGQAFAPLAMERAVPGLSPMTGGFGAGAVEAGPGAEDAARHFGAAAAPSRAEPGRSGVPGGRRDEDGGVRVWAGGAITLGERDPTTGEAELSVSTTGISLGADFSVGDRLDLGAGLGFGQERTDVGVDGSRLEAETWAGVAYGSFRPVEGVFVDGVLGYGRLSFDMRRRTPVAGDLVFGDRDGSAWFGSLRAGVERGREDLRWSAFGGVETVNAELDAFAERGSATEALAFAARRVESLQGVWGLRLERDLAGPGGLWSPGARLEWRHEFGEGGAQLIRYADWLDGPAYEIGHDGWDRGELTVGLSLVVRTYRGWSISAEHDARLSRNQTMNGFRLGVTRAF